MIPLAVIDNGDGTFYLLIQTSDGNRFRVPVIPTKEKV